MPHEVQVHQPPEARLDALIQKISEFSDPRARATAEELVQTLLDLYGEALARLLEITAESQASGLELIDTFASDDLLSPLFLLHGLHPVDLETRVMLALDEVRPYLKSHGGNVEFVKLEGNVAYLRLEGSCHGCPGSTNTLKLAIEEVLYKAAPDLGGLQVEGVTEPPARAGIPVTFVPPKRNKDTARPEKPTGGWSVVEGLLPLLPDTLKPVMVYKTPLLFLQIAGTCYAYHNRCSNCSAPLDDGILEGTTLRCLSCGSSYDICRAGRSLDAAGLFLEAVPLLVEDGKVKVALSSVGGKDDQPQAVLTTQASAR